MKVWYKDSDPTKVISFGKSSGESGESHFIAKPQELDHEFYTIGAGPSLVRKDQAVIDQIIADRATAAAANDVEMAGLYDKVRELIDTVSYAQMNNFIDTQFASLNAQQRKFLKLVGFVCLHYGKKNT